MTGSTALSALVAAAILLPFGGGAHRKAEHGNRQYADGAYDDALRSYTEAQVLEPESPELFYDIGNVLYRQGDYEGAAEAYSRALTLSDAESVVAPAAHNLGNARYALKQYPEAVDAYERALRAAPTDADTQRNLELALRALEQQQQQQPQQDQQQEQQEEQEQQQDQQQQQPGEQSEKSPQEPDGEPQQGAGEDQAPEGQGAGEMGKEQAERLLQGLAEQEAENLREHALQKPQPDAAAPEIDW